jgi:hypothetical protein
MSWRVVDGPAVRYVSSAARNGRRLTPLRSMRISTALAPLAMHCVRYALALGLLACATELPSGDTTLADGRSLRQLVANSDSVVVLLLDPEECLGCNPNFAAWMEWARNNPTRFALVLSRVPTPDEVRRLAALHVVPSGALSRTWRHIVSSPDTPMEMLFVGGRLAVSARASLRGPEMILQQRIRDSSKLSTQ